MSNHVIHVKSCYSCQIIPFVVPAVSESIHRKNQAIASQAVQVLNVSLLQPSLLTSYFTGTKDGQFPLSSHHMMTRVAIIS
jgi:hypothetical protein